MAIGGGHFEVTYLEGWSSKKCTFAHKGGVKISENFAYVLCGWPYSQVEILSVT